MSTRTLSVLGLALALTALVALPAGATPPRGYELEAPLTGPKEVPGPGDPDGVGAAYLDMNRGTRSICFRVKAQYIETATMGHIHRGGPTVAGPVVVPLFMGPAPTGRRCVTTTAALRKEIALHPARFYVNVHNAGYPAGAIRGQVER